MLPAVWSRWQCVFDQHADRLAGLRLDRGTKLARQARILLRVDGDDPLWGLDRAGIGVAARADPGMDAVGDGQKLCFHGTSLA